MPRKASSPQGSTNDRPTKRRWVRAMRPDRRARVGDPHTSRSYDAPRATRSLATSESGEAWLLEKLRNPQHVRVHVVLVLPVARTVLPPSGTHRAVPRPRRHRPSGVLKEWRQIPRTRLARWDDRRLRTLSAELPAGNGAGGQEVWRDRHARFMIVVAQCPTQRRTGDERCADMAASR